MKIIEISQGWRRREIVVHFNVKGIGRHGPRKVSRTLHQRWDGSRWMPELKG